MITRKQWQKYCNDIRRLIVDYDIWIKGHRVISVEEDTVTTEDLTNKQHIAYKFPDSFEKATIRALSELLYLSKIKTKPEKVINTNMYSFLRKNG